MKIKELHLRNIASIEKADINFEKDLNDAVSGGPAQIFLISGDTGAGKSVILDGISMALYKNTPRVSGVSDQKNNKYTNREGELVQVNDISQYTRLGISPSDECYSEVVFIGNDGAEYRARLTLGICQTRADSEGKSYLKYREPVWEVHSGTEVKINSEAKKTILKPDVVGLSFEQFSRMAMLAQGQFAAFLTGGKKERESILEQLTNTEKFSDYGNAVKRLCDKAKGDRDKLQVGYDTESQHTLPQEKVDELTEEKNSLTSEKKKLDDQNDKNEETIRLVEAVLKGQADAKCEGEKKARLEAVAAGEEYKSAKALAADWDATATERQKLDDLNKSTAKLHQEKVNIQTQEKLFTSLSADLEARRQALAAMGDPQKAVDTKQAEIDKLISQRDALNPGKINSDIKAVNDNIKELTVISGREKSISDKNKDLNALAGEITADEGTIAGYKQEYANAETAYKAAKQNYDETNAKLTTMSTCVDDMLTSLRKRLIEEHAQTCPLCGGHITDIPLEEEFRERLTPFEQKQKAAEKALYGAENIRDMHKSQFDRFSGELSNKKTRFKKDSKALADDRQAFEKEASKFDIDVTKPLAEQIDSLQADYQRRLRELVNCQKQAENLQKAIDKATGEKKPLDAGLRRYNADSRTVKAIESIRDSILDKYPQWNRPVSPKTCQCGNITAEWNNLNNAVTTVAANIANLEDRIKECKNVLDEYYAASGKTAEDLKALISHAGEIDQAKKSVKRVDEDLKSASDAHSKALGEISKALQGLKVADEKDIPSMDGLLDLRKEMENRNNEIVGRTQVIDSQLKDNEANLKRLSRIEAELNLAKSKAAKWEKLNSIFGGGKFRTLVQTYILRPLLNNANIYLEKITDRYRLTCSEDNEQLSILVQDRYNKDQIRSATVLSGGERFMISLALSLALSSLNRPDLNVDILFIDEGFGTLDQKNLNSVMSTLEKLREIAGESNRRVGIISHREELDERIPVQIHVKKKGEGRSVVETICRE